MRILVDESTRMGGWSVKRTIGLGAYISLETLYEIESEQDDRTSGQASEGDLQRPSSALPLPVDANDNPELSQAQYPISPWSASLEVCLDVSDHRTGTERIIPICSGDARGDVAGSEDQRRKECTGYSSRLKGMMTSQQHWR